MAYDKLLESSNYNTVDAIDPVQAILQNNVLTKKYRDFLSILKEEIGNEKLETFKQNEGDIWLGFAKDESLYQLWRSTKDKISTFETKINNN